MDLMPILMGTFSGLNFGQIVAGIIGGVLIKALFDNVLVILLGKYWPSKAITVMLDKIKWFDDNVLDVVKKEYPKTGKELERKFIAFLDSAKEIIKN